MALSLNSDLPTFFDTADFAVSAVIGGVSVDVIFDHEYREVTVGGVPVAGEYPVVTCSESEVTPSYGLTVTVNSTSYKVVDWQADGTGTILLILEKQ